jgi:predicted DNA-binding transcriptional regulator AlpA
MHPHDNKPLLDDYLSPDELVAELGICNRTLARWHALGIAPRKTAIGRKILYKRSSVTEWLNARERNGAA